LEWIEAQNALTFSFLESIPSRARIKQRLTELWDYPKVSAPTTRGGKFFQLRNSGLQNQDVLYTMDSPGAEGRVLLDPNTLSPDGTVALTGRKASKDGCWMAYATSASGSDWMTWRVRSVETGEDLPEEILWSKFSTAAWLVDGSGFYYTRYEEPREGQAYEDANLYPKVYLHHLGEPQAQDQLVYHRPDQKEWGFHPDVTDDGRYLLLTVWQGTDSRNRFFYQDLQNGGGFVELIGELEAKYEFAGNDGTLFYFHTDLGAPRGRLIAIDIASPEREKWITLVPEDTDVLVAAKIVHDEFVTLYLHNAYNQIKRYGLDGRPLGDIELPTLGSILEINGRREDDELFYTFHSFAFPPTVYRYDFQRQASQILAAPSIQFDFAAYETSQVFATSKDGAQVPVFLVHRKGLALDGLNPTLLYGYGGFNISLSPAFSISRLAWLELGGVLAAACLRGGGEFGEEWHRAGMIHQKQNVFDDFIACAEFLIRERYTSTPKLAIQGRSNGGLLVGACLNQRPELFGAALPGVGVMDMLRFHRFTIGWAWVSDYGSSADPEEFKTLFTYSPLHNICPGRSYPATLVTTGDHDDRVVPGHSFKYAAALQAAQAGEAPILIRIQTRAGHGFGKPTAIVIEEETDNWAFLTKVLDMA
jgi:prolyl oligopeptidase